MARSPAVIDQALDHEADIPRRREALWYSDPREVPMVVSLKPELQKLVDEKVRAGLFPSAEAQVNSAVEQVVATDDLQPGEMEKLLAIGDEQARQGKLVDGDAAFAKLKSRSEAARERT
jgi:Arc/MetJ-type ribon-helix-helix transcriptional regulator